MHWIRSNIRLSARLALLALSLQFASSFGHVHPEDLVPAAAATHAAAAVQQSRSDPSVPARKPGGADDVCAVCALILLLNTSVVSAALPLPVATGVRRVRWQAAFDFSPALPSRRFFSARAPPLA